MIAAFELWPTSPWYLAGGQANGMFPRSDTLSAALFMAWRQLDPTAAADANGIPPFRASSALPTLRGKDGTVHALLPAPVGLWREATAGRADSKAQKKVLYCDQAALGALMKGQLAAVKLSSMADGAIAIATPGPATGPFATALERTRLAVDRYTGGPIHSMLFDSKAWFAETDCGMGVLIEHESDAALRIAESALRLLGMEGLGADRSTGAGQFDVKGPIPWKAPSLGKGSRLLLSLCHPTRQEVEGGILDGRYELVNRGGWITAPGARHLRRGRVRFLAEGSVIPGAVSPSPGDVVEVQRALPDQGLDHRVIRDGRAITLEIGGLS